METGNHISANPPSTLLNLETKVPDQPTNVVATQQLAVAKVPRKRTKTGCLTCRQRRIKCGEEKPICKNCTKSKRECKGYAQRLIFKNPLGIPGVPSTIPAQPAPPSSQFESQIDFSQTSAGTHGPILAPKIPAASSIEHRQSRPSVDISADILKSDAAFADQVPGLPPSYQPANLSARFSQPGQEASAFAQNVYPHYSVHDWDSPQTQNQGLAIKESSSRTETPPQVYQNVKVAESPPAVNLPTQHSAEHQASTHDQYRSPSSQLLSPFHYIEDEEGDYYDVESDEEPDQVAMQDFNQLNMVLASANRDATQHRSFTTYLNEANMLATYQPDLGSSPFNNPKTARIFLHFIHATGPVLSIFERHGTDQSTMLGAPVPMAQQGLWTYTLPLKSFQNQALQQAILALGSLHIAYLQQAPSTSSLKHYQFALRRIGKAVGLPMQRKQLGTLAASLLLAYYEVMVADHTKWNNHLAGSAQLIREIDWAGITRDLRAQRRKRWLERSNTHSFFQDVYMFNNPSSSDDSFAELETRIDEDLIGCFLGRAVNYDEFGQVEGEHAQPRNRHLSRKDIETFRTQCDLYWWYCKQDWLQSIISGGQLSLPYSEWGLCPPRAGIGLRNDLYGTADHLTLLMGRLADFGVRDRKRKINMAKATGSGWRPDARFDQEAQVKVLLMIDLDHLVGLLGLPGMGLPDMGLPDTRLPDMGFLDMGFLDMGLLDMGLLDMGLLDMGLLDMGLLDMGLLDMGLLDMKAPSGLPVVLLLNHLPSMRSSSGSSPEPPPFYGMVPPSGPTRLPAAFATTSDRNDSCPRPEEDVDMSYEEAEREWEGIYAAFEVFAQSLGPDFEPLSPEASRPIYSPFGLATQYYTLNMAGLMAFYYTGRMLLLRLHPSMPPWMHVAAGFAAATTAEYAQTIGKIAAGIYGAQTGQGGIEGFSPVVGSCLIDVTVPIFFAAVQYTAPDQRKWIIAVLRDISRYTGWKSSDAVAHGCERSWRNAAMQGRGPPYNQDGGVQKPPVWKYAEYEANKERRFIMAEPYVWAMGILSLDDKDFGE
ncbi:putative C6 finger domain protein [Aspergillus mulundensis]|uniref:Putative Zn(II)2Cys6 transcription factor n=1 Tax=Aspergillus mulundensis TaxID=1810919 RepID=A0A3D8SWX0_9EURO|nr:putative Zn(II)2Cys6 transcription factor [Aspergillus mulundensis]RDW90827.1 putative Zn(II)2Cys6 transcription factor [Aspergillus mulundensis]